jgi:hypothetical protein
VAEEQRRKAGTEIMMRLSEQYIEQDSDFKEKTETTDLM